ncbi:TPA: hypothetical protein I7264_21365 [Vibrio parahaemolyticus]|uniref:hypothetical protein n=1 Tax=Vibrio TaxID=662 RepID=UPI00146BD456|nr:MULTISPECIES: hypothetical protein [Vibrio]MDF5052422.1 hypothetical protein [Vibrio parahaemolyticus]MDF5113172.1 hypothetical protein [Vibrio parahaemolyticus]MDF5127997.1 hypothetical protein [Vibrio parahaemolyticus]MDF5132167.1 hypothetical protein [Vibrio parahaemolyticus]MDF5264731.1 hypothetical protein [Vibrio parahaemolyticus]
MSELRPFKIGKKKKITIGRRQAERATEICNKVGKTPEKLIKDEIEKHSMT